jgi:hypothetical protein
MDKEVVKAAFLGEENDFMEQEIDNIRKLVPDKAKKLREKEIRIYPTFEENFYEVKSETDDGYNKYKVREEEDKHICTCKDYFFNNHDNDNNYACKHIWLTRIFIKAGLFDMGSGKRYIINLCNMFEDNRKIQDKLKEIKDKEELEITVEDECIEIARLL